ncbi:hypothetical protein D9M71_626210 [compost metagenome]
MASLFQSAFGDTKEYVGEMQLGDQRAQAGEGCAQRAGVEKHLVLFDAHALESSAAAVGLALAHVVPVIMQCDTGPAAGDGSDQQLAASTFIDRRGNQHFRVAGA